MRKIVRVLIFVSVLSCAFFPTASGQQASTPSLERGFQEPPQSARPRVWWHWMNGNISKDGIKLDLDWMHRVGIAGFQNFDAALQTPQVVDKRLAYMTPEWKDAFKFAIDVGNQYGMEMAIAGSPGWSETGGPWVTAAQGMKKYVWSETVLEGGKPFTGKIAHPPEQHRCLSGYGYPRAVWAGLNTETSGVLRGCCGRSLSRPLRRNWGRRRPAENHLQRRWTGRRDVERRGPGEDHERADSRDPVRNPGSSSNIPRRTRFAAPPM